MKKLGQPTTEAPLFAFRGTREKRRCCVGAWAVFPRVVAREATTAPSTRVCAVVASCNRPSSSNSSAILRPAHQQQKPSPPDPSSPLPSPPLSPLPYPTLPYLTDNRVHVDLPGLLPPPLLSETGRLRGDIGGSHRGGGGGEGKASLLGVVLGHYLALHGGLAADRARFHSLASGGIVEGRCICCASVF